jgi:hypothetical protein
LKTVTTPTVGRKVWYRPQASDLTGPVPMVMSGAEPLDATVIAVWGNRMINVLVTDIMGRQFPVLSCALLQEGDQPPTDAEGKVTGRYCEWMPYQLTKAKEEAPKTEGTALNEAAAEGAEAITN